MRNILDLARRDLRQASRNVMAGIVLFGLVIIPSLFTWFNVIASWDPFGSTNGLKVAVASTDEGYESALMPIRVDVGEQVLSQLRANDDLDWVITSEEDAIDGTRSGAYYAAIVLPESFSADMLTFYANDAEPTDIAFYTNEKKNALAPKITEQGAEALSSQINESFTRTLSDVALGLMSSFSDYLTDEETQAALGRVESQVAGLSAQLRSGARTADMLTGLVESSIPIVDSAESLMTTANGAFSDTSTALGGGATAVRDLASVLQGATSSLADALDAAVDGYEAVSTRIDELYAAGDAVSSDQAQLLHTLADDVQLQIDRTQSLKNRIEEEIAPLPEEEQAAFTKLLARLDDAIARQEIVRDRLNQTAQEIADGNAKAQESRQAVQQALEDAKAAFASAKQSYTETLKPQLDALSATFATIGSEIDGIRGDLSSASSRLSGSGESVRAALDRAREATARLSEQLNDDADSLDEVQQALAKAMDTGDLSELASVIGSDPGMLATSLAEPVRVDRTAVFPITGFGAGMAPLYAALALWVGALLMTVAIRVDVSREALPDRPELTPTQSYLGRYVVFALLGLAQSTLVTLGLVLFVQIEPAHPLLLVLAGWITSLVFTLIVYTAVVAFGNAGKALAVLLLVFQISGSGGAYPLQLLPEWFQNLSPFLPASYAVDAMRSAIAGSYAGDYWIALGTLALFAIPALLLGLVLRRPLISFNRNLIESLESTKLM